MKRKGLQTTLDFVTVPPPASKNKQKTHVPPLWTNKTSTSTTTLDSIISPLHFNPSKIGVIDYLIIQGEGQLMIKVEDKMIKLINPNPTKDTIRLELIVSQHQNTKVKLKITLNPQKIYKASIKNDNTTQTTTHIQKTTPSSSFSSSTFHSNHKIITPFGSYHQSRGVIFNDDTLIIDQLKPTHKIIVHGQDLTSLIRSYLDGKLIFEQSILDDKPTSFPSSPSCCSSAPTNNPLSPPPSYHDFSDEFILPPSSLTMDLTHLQMSQSAKLIFQFSPFLFKTHPLNLFFTLFDQSQLKITFHPDTPFCSNLNSQTSLSSLHLNLHHDSTFSIQKNRQLVTQHLIFTLHDKSALSDVLATSSISGQCLNQSFLLIYRHLNTSSKITKDPTCVTCNIFAI